MMTLGIGSQVSSNGFNGTCGGANLLTYSVGTVTDDNWGSGGVGGSYGMDPSHWPTTGVVAYFISGKRYYYEETIKNGAYMVAFDRGCPASFGFSNRGGALGIAYSIQEGRGTAWNTKAQLHAYEVSVDGSPERNYSFDKLQNSAIFRQGTYSLPNTDPSRAAAYTFGVSKADSPATNAFHTFLALGNQYCEGPLDTSATTNCQNASSPWEWQYTIEVYSHARDQGIPGYDSVLNWYSKQWFHKVLDPACGGIFMGGTYRIPAKLKSTGDWVQGCTDWLASFTAGNGGGISTSWTDQAHSQRPCNYSPVDDHWHAALLAVLGMLYPYNVDGFTGQQAYDVTRLSLYQAPPFGCMQQMFNDPVSQPGASPKWDILARRAAVVQASSGSKTGSCNENLFTAANLGISHAAKACKP
jgi:hypothetical protein